MTQPCLQNLTNSVISQNIALIMIYEWSYPTITKTKSKSFSKAGI